MQGYNQMNFLPLLVSAAAFLFSSVSASSFPVDFSCPGLSGKAKQEYEYLMSSLRASRPGLVDCMRHYQTYRQSKLVFTMCISALGMPSQLLSYFIDTSINEPDMKQKIYNVANDICRKYRNETGLPQMDDISSGMMNSLPAHHSGIDAFASNFNIFFLVVAVVGGLIFIISFAAFSVILYKTITGPKAKAVIITDYEDVKSSNKDVKINIAGLSNESSEPPSYQEATLSQSKSYTQELHSKQAKN